MDAMKKYVYLISLIGLLGCLQISYGQTYTDQHYTAIANFNRPIKEPIAGKKEPEPEKKESKEKAESPLTGTFSFLSNYIYRGISQTNNKPALQGELIYTFKKTGIYLNLWGSNDHFEDVNGHIASVEIDPIVGIANPIGEHFNYDINYQYYHYPQTDHVNYGELVANLQYYFLTGILSYSNNVFASGKSGTYYNLGIKFEIPPKFILCLQNMELSAGMGHYDLPRSAGLLSYNDYSVQLSKTVGNYVLAALWTDTNRKSIDKPSLKGCQVVGSVTANF